jgi:hypothetical protein
VLLASRTGAVGLRHHPAVLNHWTRTFTRRMVPGVYNPQEHLQHFNLASQLSVLLHQLHQLHSRHVIRGLRACAHSLC